MKLFYSTQTGRSMIEMLGVLAIVGVLSVGGIAGYSKAMSTYRVNKLIEEYSMFINSILEHMPAFKRAGKGFTNENRLYLAPVLENMKILPQYWSRTENDIFDSTGRRALIYTRDTRLTFLFYIYNGNSTRNSSTREDVLLCQRIITDITLQYTAIIKEAYIWQANNNGLELGYGDNFCNKETTCLHSLNIPTIVEACRICVGEQNSCTIAMDFPL